MKSDFEISLLRESGAHHCGSYRRISGLYHEGMTDIELQIEIERTLRLDGCLGIFRINGPSMELFMGNLLVGDNADAPSPYDFAMGGLAERVWTARFLWAAMAPSSFRATP